MDAIPATIRLGPDRVSAKPGSVGGALWLCFTCPAAAVLSPPRCVSRRWTWRLRTCLSPTISAAAFSASYLTFIGVLMIAKFTDPLPIDRRTAHADNSPIPFLPEPVWPEDWGPPLRLPGLPATATAAASGRRSDFGPIDRAGRCSARNEKPLWPCPLGTARNLRDREDGLLLCRPRPAAPDCDDRPSGTTSMALRRSLVGAGSDRDPVAPFRSPGGPQRRDFCVPDSVRGIRPSSYG